MSFDSCSVNSSLENVPAKRKLFRSKLLEKAPLLSQRKLVRSLSGRTQVHEPSSADTDFVNGNNNDENNSLRTLGTFSGVFAPVSLSQFSTILFLRIGFVIGSIGLLLSCGTLTLAYIILMFTILSICAISTNGAVEGGGAYFMISRTLGPEFGGAIGALFFFANVFSSALYTTGCVEGVLENFGENAGDLAIYSILPEGDWYNFAYGSVLNMFYILICLVGAVMFAKTTVIILIIVLICMVSVIISFLVIPGNLEVPIPSDNEEHANTTGNYTGFSVKTLEENLYPTNVTDYTTGNVVDFATAFSVLFSGVTGIMAGANLSGELKNPGRSIPVGTLFASGFTFIVYSLLFLLTSSTTSRYLLQNNFSFMLGINVWPPFIVIGVFTSTVSASLSNIIGASRVLAALVKDNIYGSMTRWIGFISYGSNPIGAVIVTGLLVEGVLLIGQLNTIARFTSVFFLLSYMSTNIACLSLEWASAPNFRPTFRYFSWWTAALGILSNGVLMFIISPIYSAVCIIICLLLIIILHLRSPSEQHQWGSISQALIFHQVRKYLLLLDTRKDHVKFWRPQVLLLVSDPVSARPLVDFTNDLKKSGLYILGHVKIENYSGDGPDPALFEYSRWQDLVDQLKVKAFIEITVSDSVRNGMQQLVRISGLGAMKPNTIILGFCRNVSSENSSNISENFNDGDLRSQEQSRKCNNWKNDDQQQNLHATEFVAMIKDILNMGKNVCVCRHFHLLDKEALLTKARSKSFIDIWPMDFFNPDETNVFDTSSLFLIQLATVLNMVSSWKKKTQLRVFLCFSSGSIDPEKQKLQVQNTLRELRIQASISVISWTRAFSIFKTSSHNDCSTSGASAVQSGFENLCENYIMEVNRLIRENSVNTALSFMNLPCPPPDPTQYKTYIKYLTNFTENLKPTVLIHGVSTVTTTNL
ncbi:UNVERIFIED_CONTAM: hypothetical protein RMT77_006305 [Armadillidium vulgare]